MSVVNTSPSLFVWYLVDVAPFGQHSRAANEAKSWTEDRHGVVDACSNIRSSIVTYSESYQTFYTLKND